MRFFQPPPRRGNAAAFFASLILLALVPNASWGGFEPDRVSQNGRETHLASVPRGADDLVLMNEIVRLTRFDALGSVLGEEQHTQDSNGNRIQEADLRLFWDSFDRLVRVERTSDGLVVGRYRYDALGRRVDRSFVAQGEVASQQVFHVHDGAREVEELDAAGNVLADFVWGGMYVDELVQLRRGGQTYYAHASSIYSVAALSDPAGNAVERYAYQSIYGVVQVQDGAGAPKSVAAEVGNPWRFQGRRFDPETGWYYFRARCLDPARGRFVSRDPLGLWGDLGQVGNSYSFAGNDPVNGVDPSGELTPTTAPIPGLGLGPAPLAGPGGAPLRPSPGGVGPAWVYAGVAYLTEGWFGLYAAQQETMIALEQGAQLAQKADLLGKLRLLRRLKRIADGFEEVIDYGLLPEPSSNPGQGVTPSLTPAAPASSPYPEIGKALEILTETDKETEDRRVDFFTVQDPADAQRLRTTGAPWPEDPLRARWGPGVYAWATRAEAEAYQAVLNGPTEILKFSISIRDLMRLPQLHIGKLPSDVATQWTNTHDRIYGEGRPHPYLYVSGPTTRFGFTEHYFHSSVWPLLRWSC